MPKSQIQKLIETGIEFSEMSRKQAESFVTSLVKAGEVRKKDADELVQTLVERGKQTSEQIAATVQRELAKQLSALASRFDDLEHSVEELTEQVMALVPHRQPSAKVEAQPAKKQAATKKKAAAKKAATKKKAAAKKRAATKKKAAAKKSGAVGPSGVRKVNTSRDS